jgi:RNA processing factor Prp31
MAEENVPKKPREIIVSAEKAIEDIDKLLNELAEEMKNDKVGGTES